MEQHIKTRMIKNLLLSIFIYALPVLLMLLSFYVTGQKPWLKKPVQKANTTASVPKK